MVQLETRGLTRQFGGLTAVDALSLSVDGGAIHGLIGPNGAGKSTAYNVITGFYKPTNGEVIYEGENISGLEPHRIAAKGLVRSFQNGSVYAEFTVLENVLAATFLQARSGFLSTLLGFNRQREADARSRALELLDTFELADRAGEQASNLPHGAQQRLGVAVGMASRPRMLLLDEPFTGMNAEETREMMNIVRHVRDLGTTVLIVEHDMQAVMELCDRVSVLNFGQLLAEGTPHEVRNNPAVIEAYLGSAGDAAAAS